MEKVIACPLCGDKIGHHHKHLYVNEETQVYFCHLCGAGGSLVSLLRKFPRLGKEITVAEIARLSYNEGKPIAPVASWTRLSDASAVLARKVVTYLRGRGLHDGDIGRAYWSPKMSGRAIFPCYEKGEMVFWSARSMCDAHPKWRFPREGETKLTRKDAVWGLDYFEGHPGGEVWITEGVFDAIAVAGVAVHGKFASQSQIKKILGLRPKKVVVALDKDAEEQAEKLAGKLRHIVSTEIRYAPEPLKDWGELLVSGLRK